MRLYPYVFLALPLSLALGACTYETCGAEPRKGVSFRCSIDPTVAGTTTTAGTDSASSTDDPTDTASTSTSSGTSTSTTDDTSTSEPGTSTSSTATTDTTTGGPVGEPTTFGQACAPDDGPATEFKIGLAARECSSDFPEDAPIFRITIFQGAPLAPGEYKLDGGNGFAYLDTGDGMPLTGDTGIVTITGMSADGLLGTYDVTLSDNTNLAGDLDALYCPVDVLCG